MRGVRRPRCSHQPAVDAARWDGVRLRRGHGVSLIELLAAVLAMAIWFVCVLSGVG
jgi:hypothetical protein